MKTIAKRVTVSRNVTDGRRRVTAIAAKCGLVFALCGLSACGNNNNGPASDNTGGGTSMPSAGANGIAGNATGDGSGGSPSAGGTGSTAVGGAGGSVVGGGGSGMNAAGGTMGSAGNSNGGGAGGTQLPQAGTALVGTCPTGVTWNTLAKDQYPGTMDKATGFIDPSFKVANETRSFVVRLPPNYDPNKVYPVLTIITGTVESTIQSMFETSAQLGQAFLAKDWILLGPIRRCSNGDQGSVAQCPNDTTPGFTWWPWAEGAATASTQYINKAGPDAEYMKAMVQCAAMRYKLDSSRLFAAGVSSGGTMTNRLLTYQNNFWAGGVPESGEWYVGAGASDEEQIVQAAPTKLYTGRAVPNPLPKTMSPMFVVEVWEGAHDIWCSNSSSNCTVPSTSILSDYRPATQAASNFYSSMPNIINVACSVNHFHQWQQVPEFNPWLADLLRAHPKGSTVAPAPTGFKLNPPAPAGTMMMSCVVGPYTDHY